MSLIEASPGLIGEHSSGRIARFWRWAKYIRNEPCSSEWSDLSYSVLRCEPAQVLQVPTRYYYYALPVVNELLYLLIMLQVLVLGDNTSTNRESELVGTC